MQNAEYKAIKSFTDLNTWKEGHQLVLAIYKMTKLFPLLISKDLGYINLSQFKEISFQTVVVSKLINGLIKSVKKKHNT